MGRVHVNELPLAKSKLSRIEACFGFLNVSMLYHFRHSTDVIWTSIFGQQIRPVREIFVSFQKGRW